MRTFIDGRFNEFHLYLSYYNRIVLVRLHCYSMIVVYSNFSTTAKYVITDTHITLWNQYHPMHRHGTRKSVQNQNKYKYYMQPCTSLDFLYSDQIINSARLKKFLGRLWSLVVVEWYPDYNDQNIMIKWYDIDDIVMNPNLYTETETN